MKTISISYLQTLIKSGKKEFNSILLEGDLLNWDILEDFDNKKKNLLILEVADESNSINVLIRSTTKKRSPSDYFIAFAHAGIKIKLNGNFKVYPVKNFPLNTNLYSIMMSFNAKSTDIEIRGCPSYRKWTQKKTQAARSNTRLSTAAELFSEQISNRSTWKEYAYSRVKPVSKNNYLSNRYKNTSNEFQSKKTDENIWNSPTNFEIPEIFPSKDFEWFFTEKGMSIFSFPIKDPFFISNINYTRPRLSFVFQFNPPDYGKVALYWMNKKHKWIRIGEIRAKNKTNYDILKHFVNEIKTIDELQKKLDLKNVPNVKKLADFEIE